MQIILRHVIFFYSVDTQNIKKYFPFIFLFVIISTLFGASQVVQLVKNLLANAGYIRDVSSIPMSGRSPGEGNGNPLQFLAWKIPGTEGPGGLQSTGLQRLGYDWVYTHRRYLIPRYSSDIYLKMCCICTWLKIRYQLKNHSLPRYHADTYTSQNSLVGVDFLHVSGNSQRNTT